MAEVIYDGPQRARDIVLGQGRTIRADKGVPVEVSTQTRDKLIRQRHWSKPKGRSTVNESGGEAIGKKED